MEEATDIHSLHTTYNLKFIFIIIVPDISRASEYGYSDRPMVYSYVNCRGHEASISDCSLLEYLRFNCYYTYSAGVLCTDGMFKL